MSDLTREELNKKAAELGVENPESYGTKAELQEAVDQAENNNETNTNDQDRSNEERADDSGSTVDGLHDTRDGADLDGTRELEQPHDAAEGRSAAVQAGKDAARENLAREREADERDGSDNPQKSQALGEYIFVESPSSSDS